MLLSLLFDINIGQQKVVVWILVRGKQGKQKQVKVAFNAKDWQLFCDDQIANRFQSLGAYPQYVYR